MGLLDNFYVYGHKRSGKIFISITSYGITFSKSCVESLDYANFVHVCFENNGARMAVKPCKKDEKSRIFVKNRNSPRASFVRWTDKNLVAHLMSIAGT